MIVYGASLSPFVKKVMVVLDHKALSYELQRSNVDLESFAACSPFKKMPALDDDDYRLADSSAICAYLDAQYPEHNLIPHDPKARGRTIWWDEYADTILAGAGLKILFNRLVGPVLMKVPTDLAVADKAEKEELPPILAYFEANLPASGWLVEDRMTLADISVAAVFAALAHLPIAPSAVDFPKTRAFLDKMFAMPVFSKAREQEEAFIAFMKK